MNEAIPMDHPTVRYFYSAPVFTMTSTEAGIYASLAEHQFTVLPNVDPIHALKLFWIPLIFNIYTFSPGI